MYQLKNSQESFTVVEGAFAGRRFEPGKLYEDVPQTDAGKFVKIKETAPEADTIKPVNISGKKGIDAPEKSEVKS